MRILFVHHYFPGQFKRIAAHYVAQGHDVVALYRGVTDGRASTPVEGVRMIAYGQEVKADRPDDHVLHDIDQYVREAASAGFCAVDLRDAGWTPDLVYDHTGWGTGAFLHDVFPEAAQIRYCEWFFNNTASSGEFLSGERPYEQRFLNTLMNAPVMMDLCAADLLIAPTEWQRAQFPNSIRRSIEIVPDGIDTDLFKPDAQAQYRLPDGRILMAGAPVVTYVARGADPFRGFKSFMQALAILQQRNDQVQAVIVGDQTVYYGAGVGSDQHFHEVMDSVSIDTMRTHFTGVLPYDQYRRILQVSAAHVYLTAPFVLSWSALEALSTGCAFVGSDTAPVREFVKDSQHGLLADFNDPAAIADAIARMLAGGPDVAAMRTAARAMVLERWSADTAIALHQSLVDGLIADKGRDKH